MAERLAPSQEGISYKELFVYIIWKTGLVK
jgi:hypothetical protein